MREQRIKTLIQSELEPAHFEIVNESHMHSGPATESHFKILVVSDSFKNLNRVKRQQKLYALLNEEFDSGLHALSMRLKTLEEWNNLSDSSQSFQSPDCQHKNKL